MTYETLHQAMTEALKAGRKDEKNALAGFIAQIQKTAIDKGCRDNITEDLVNAELLKIKKSIQEQIDTCPDERIETLEEYKEQMAIVAEFAPTLITDETEIRYLILDIVNNEHEFSKSNRGILMKIIAPVLKGKADMGVVNKVLGGMLK